MRFRFVHAADLHLDTPFQGISRAAPHVGASLQEASLEAFDKVVQLTIDRDAHFLLLAGDIYDGIDRGIRAQLRFLRGLQRLSEHNIRTFIVHGNHDPLTGWSAIREWPSHVKVFGAKEVQAVEIDIEGVSVATLYGISFSQPHVTQNLSRLFQRLSTPGVHIGLLHCNVNSFDEHSAYAPCSEEDLCEQGFNYWALGHIHKHRQWKRKDTWIAYSGNTQGRSPKPTERGSKGVLVVECENGEILGTPEFVPVDIVRFCQIKVDIESYGDLPTLQKVLLERSESLSSENPNRSLLIRTTLEGRGEITTDLQRPDALEELRKELNTLTSQGNNFIWWDRLSDNTRSVVERNVLRMRGDFISELVKLVDSLATDPDSLRELMRNQLSALKSERISKYWNGAEDSDMLSEILTAAEQMVFDMTDVEEGIKQ